MLKYNVSEESKNFENPKNVHPIEADKIADKYSHITAEKGQMGLSQFYSYVITDEWVEIDKPHKEKLPEDKRCYLGLITILCDTQTQKPVRKGSISLNKLIQPYPTYEGNDIKNVCSIVQL